MQSGLELYDPKHQYRADKAKRKQDFNNCCAYCGNSPVFLTIDHVIPRSQGGTNAPSNLLPACKSCNESKGSRSLTNWYTPRNRRYTSERWEKILVVINTIE
jgi:5-methylcytosine-specific restriction endonuclease McrA